VRNLFDWQPPAGVDIAQTFGDAYPLQNGTEHRDVRFTARCRCGASSEPRAARCDALDELDGHACQPALVTVPEAGLMERIESMWRRFRHRLYRNRAGWRRSPWAGGARYWYEPDDGWPTGPLSGGEHD